MIEVREMDTTPNVGPWQLPDGWEWVPLGDICKVIIGGTPNRRNPDYWGSGYTWITIADLDTRFITSSKEEITDLGVANSNVKEIDKGTILMSFKLTIGKLAISGKKLYTNEAIAALPIKASWSERLQRDFLFHALHVVPLSGEADLAVKGRTLNKEKLARILIPIPFLNDPTRSLDIQHRIVDRTEALLADLTEAQHTLDEMYRDIDQVMNSASLEVFKEVSKNTELVLLGPRTTKIGSGSTPRGANYEETGIPFIRSLNVLWNKFTDKDLKFISPTVHTRMRGTEVRIGDVLLNITGASIGRSCCPPENYLPANVNQHVAIIRPKQELRSRFLMYWLTSPDTQQIIDNLQSGATRQALTKAQITQFQIPLPDIILQERIINYLDSIQEGVDELQEMLREDDEILQQLEQGILNQAFRGGL